MFLAAPVLDPAAAPGLPAGVPLPALGILAQAGGMGLHAARGVRDMTDRLQIVPCELAEANAFVTQHHRHHRPVVGHKFSIAASIAERVIGVAIVGRPVARLAQDGWTLEVVRLATDGTKNACSALYSASWRAARAMGYRKLITYILSSEPGTSLRAAGWKVIGEAGGGTWSRPSRPRVAVSEAEPLPLPGWHHHDLGGPVGVGRTWSKQRREVLTMSRPAAGQMGLAP